MVQLDVEVVFVGLGTELQLLELDLALVALGGRILLLFLVLHASVVDDPTHPLTGLVDSDRSLRRLCGSG